MRRTRSDERGAMTTSRMHSITSAHPGLAVPPRESRSGLVHVIIDTPAGSRDKFKYAPKLQLFGKSRVLPAMMSFAHDFGSIPGTRAAEAALLKGIRAAAKPART